MIKKVSVAGVRITPDILVAGKKGGMLDILLAQLVKKGAAEPGKSALVLPGSAGLGATPGRPHLLRCSPAHLAFSPL